MIMYLFKSSAVLLSLIFFYKVFLEGEKSFNFNRFYLLFSLLIAVVTPLITYQVAVEWQSLYIPETSLINYTRSSEVIMKNSSVQTSQFHLQEILLALYFIGLLIFSFKFLINLKGMIDKCSLTGFRNEGKYKIIYIGQDETPYSFFNCLFLPHNANPEIIKHEKNHADALHSLDVVITELLIVIFWFNPLVHWHKKLLLLNHEFYADEKVKALNKKNYKSLIFHQISKDNVNLLASGFNFSFIKKRMIMLQKSKSGPLLWAKKIISIPVLASLCFLAINKVEAQNNLNSDANSTDKVVVKFNDQIHNDINFNVDDQNGNFSASEIAKMIKSEWSPAFDKISFTIDGRKHQGNEMGYMKYTEAKSDLSSNQLTDVIGMLIINTGKDSQGRKYRAISLGEEKTMSVRYRGNSIPPPPPPPAAPPAAPQAPNQAASAPPPPPPPPVIAPRAPPAPPTAPSASGGPPPPPPPPDVLTLSEVNAQIEHASNELKEHESGKIKLSENEVKRLKMVLETLKKHKSKYKE